MDYMQVVRVCLDFAIANNGSLQSFSEGVQKIGIHARGERKEVYIEHSKGYSWNIFSVVDGKTTVLPPFYSKDMLLNTLKGIWTTPTQAMASLMDAKLADVHAAIEKNTELLEGIIDRLQLIEQRLFNKQCISL